PEHCASLTGGWVYHAHPFPDEDITRWAEQEGIHVVTLYRHPGDVLVSYLHHLRNHPEEASWPTQLVLDDVDGPAEHTLTYVREHFAHLLSISPGWHRLGAPVVRYEDLCSRPVETLMDLTAKISPVAPTRVTVAVAMAEMRYMREAVANHARVHFRRGEVGGWATELPVELQRMLRDREPYPTLARGMGYTFERPAPLARFSYSSINPFAGRAHFDDGSAIAGIMIRAYLERAPSSFRRWPNPTATDEGSFFAWLTAWYSDGQESVTQFPVTNLAQIIYEYRRDVREFTPDHRGKDWPRFCQWYITQARLEHGLEFCFIEPMMRAFADWAVGISPRGAAGDGSAGGNLAVRGPALGRTETPSPRALP
ncbi:MAG: sulfotransferase domain-containing protein, partial [Gammaproteobacteria bacterium]